MNAAIEISLCILAWLVASIRLPSTFRHKAWRSDRIAFRIWIATFFFALTMTFLVTPIGDTINRLTAPNFSRLLAYCSVSLTLYLTAYSFMTTFPTPKNTRQLRYLKPYLLFTLGLLTIVYVFFVSRTSRWVEEPIPATAAEMAFKLTQFSYATILCILMALACYRYLDQETVAVTKYRIFAIILTASGGAAFFFTKMILALGYVWTPLGSPSIHTMSKALMTATAMLWAGSFLHNNVYTRALSIFRGFRYWLAYQDLSYLVKSLDRYCPPVAFIEEKPSFGSFIRRSEYYLYRATIRIFDGKAFIGDILNRDKGKELPKGWTELTVEEANQIFQALKYIYASGDFWDIVRSFRIASRNLARSRSIGAQEAYGWRPQS